MAYAIGMVSGCHLNPAVTVGLAAGGRFDRTILPYIIRRSLVRSAAALALCDCERRPPDSTSARVCVDGYGSILPAITAWSVLHLEGRDDDDVSLIIMGATMQGPGSLCAGWQSGSACHDSPGRIPVTNTSVNPARSQVRRYSSRWALGQGCSGSPVARRRACGVVYRWLSENRLARCKVGIMNADKGA